MRTYKIAIAATSLLALTACDVTTTRHKSSEPTLAEKIGAAMDERKVALIQAETNRLTALAEAKSKLEVAAIDAKREAIQAKAAAEENRLIEGSVKDHALLKRWSPAVAQSEDKDATVVSTTIHDVGGIGSGSCTRDASSGNIISCQ